MGDNWCAITNHHNVEPVSTQELWSKAWSSGIVPSYHQVPKKPLEIVMSPPEAWLKNKQQVIEKSLKSERLVVRDYVEQGRHAPEVMQEFKRGIRQIEIELKAHKKLKPREIGRVVASSGV